MRIIAGEAKGRKLKSIKGTSTRPTLDRIKESIFNIITPYLLIDNGLDLFAGFGGMGIEALSRGACFFTFVEKDYRNCMIIKENISLAGFEDRAEVRKEDVQKFLNHSDEKYGLIILDPPYRKGLISESIKLILEKELLNEGGIIVAEYENELEVSVPPGLDLVTEKLYGDTGLSVFKKGGIR